MRSWIAVGVAAVLQLASCAPIQSGALLNLATCNPSDQLQQLVVKAGSVGTPDGSLCVAYVGASPEALALLPCDGSQGQTWTFSPSTGAFEGNVAANGACMAWNAQGGNDSEGPGSVVSTWTCSQLNFNSVYAPNVPAAGVIGYNFTSPDSQSFSGLCVAAVNPVSPPLGTPQQVQWALDEMACFIHYNMATAAGTQGCNGCGGAPPDISLWNPSALDTDAWIAAGVAMGCKRFVYVAKHGCGFAAWNSTLDTYPYSANKAPHPVDVVRPFVASAQAAGVGYGFYYSTVTNQMCNVCSGSPQPAGPGQLNVTQAEYDAIVEYHLKELWGLFGPLTEVWFDGGYPPTETSALQALFKSLQPNVVAFQAYGLMPSPVRWVGSESGLAPYPCWSTTNGNQAGAGDPNGADWYPAETDFTLQNGDQWFFNANAGVRSPSSLRTMYEVSTGSNTALIIDFAPYPNGSIPDAQVAAATTLGDFIRGCYGKPVASTTGSGVRNFTLSLGAGASVDRVVVAEDQSQGQLVRAFSITGTSPAGATVSVATGSSVGNKFTAILPNDVTLTTLTLSISSIAVGSPTGAPFIRNFAAFSGCNALASSLDARWEAAGW